jgi:hypothetical protein
MEKKFLHGVPCVKRGNFWYRIRKPVTTVDILAARHRVASNWPSQFDIGRNYVIVNQRTT